MTKNLEENKFLFWLNSIQARAPAATILFVGTFWDMIAKETKKEADAALQAISNNIKEVQYNYCSHSTLNKLNSYMDFLLTFLRWWIVGPNR